jgi:hypothetical protein
MSCKMIKPKLRKIAIVLSSLAVLSGGLGVDTAHARDGGFPYERSGLEPLSSHQSRPGMARYAFPDAASVRRSSRTPAWVSALAFPSTVNVFAPVAVTRKHAPQTATPPRCQGLQ